MALKTKNLPSQRFWTRETGAYWLPFERERIKEFSRVKPNERLSIDGYVKLVSKQVFALLTTPFSNQIYLTCINNTGKMPPENSCINISGITRWRRLRQAANQTLQSTSYQGDLVVHVDTWKTSHRSLTLPKVQFDFRAFTHDLTARIEDLEPQIRDFLAFTAVSTPTFSCNIGGLNLTLYDSTKLGMPKSIINEMKRVIPSDLGKPCTLSTPFGDFQIRYKYAYLTENADLPLPSHAQEFLFNRSFSRMQKYDEASLSLFSTKNGPVTIEDPPCSLADVPTVVPEHAEVNRNQRGIDQIDAFEYIMANQMKTPIIEDIDPLHTVLADKLEKLAKSWDLDPTHLAKYGFLDANYAARPDSILRETLAFARANDVNIVDSQLVNRIFDEYFRWNFEYVHEIWEDLLAKPLAGGKSMASLRIEYREIIRILRKYESANPKGVPKQIIIQEAKSSSQETEQLIKDCLRSGVIYETVQEHYRLVPSYS